MFRKGVLALKVLVTSQGDSVEALADERFGRAAYFIIFEENNNNPRVMRNPGYRADQGAGVVASQAVNEEKVDVVITGHLGPHALSSLQAAGVAAYRLPGEVSVKVAYEAFLADRLEALLTQ